MFEKVSKEKERGFVAQKKQYEAAVQRIEGLDEEVKELEMSLGVLTEQKDQKSSELDEISRFIE